MLIELERHNGPVIFSTNLIENYDSAFQRRISFMVEFQLPDEECRRRMLQCFIPLRLPKSPDLNYQLLGEISQGLSPADLKEGIKQAAIQLFRSGRKLRILTTDDLIGVFNKMQKVLRSVSYPKPKTPSSG